MQYKCPKRKSCKAIFVCTYDRKEGIDFDFTPTCFVERKVRSDKGVKKTPIKVSPAPTAKKPNIWDDI